jgi:formate-dependent nitrite reductase membrane component NrfD
MSERIAGRRRRGSSDGAPVVPDVEFTSYYGRPVVKPSPWEKDIPAYLFLGGLAAGSSMLAAGADLTDRPTLRRTGRLGALVSITLSFAALVHDLGKPSRFVNMLRVAKPTSPMSVGTWILSLYGPAAALAGAAELPFLPRFVRRLLRPFSRPAGIGAAVVAPAVASYTAVLLSDTATPAWNSARRELPFVFVGSAASAAGGLGMIGARYADAGPARRLAFAGLASEVLAQQFMESSMGLSVETLQSGTAGRIERAGKVCTGVGGIGALLAEVFGRRNPRRGRALSFVAGLGLLGGSACTRFAIFEAGQASARDPKYTVVPQRERLDSR